MSIIVQSYATVTFFFCEMFSLIADRLQYNMTAVMLFWVAAIGIWPYAIWIIWRPAKARAPEQEGYLVIVRGGDQPTEYHFGK